MRDNDQNTQFTCTRLPKNKYKTKIKTATKNNGLPQVRTTLPALTGPSRLEESDDKHASALFLWGANSDPKKNTSRQNSRVSLFLQIWTIGGEEAHFLASQGEGQTVLLWSTSGQETCKQPRGQTIHAHQDPYSRQKVTREVDSPDALQHVTMCRSQDSAGSQTRNTDLTF